MSGILSRSNPAAQAAERFLNTPAVVPVAHAQHLVVRWHNSVVGQLRRDVTSWHWAHGERATPNPVTASGPGTRPPVIEGLLPEGWLGRVLRPRSDSERVAGGKRYLSNISIVKLGDDAETLSEDVLPTRLEHWCSDGRFTGTHYGPSHVVAEASVSQIAGAFRDPLVPRLSGLQTKAPMTLTKLGRLELATQGPFTHILKISSVAGFEASSAIEHACLCAKKACGFEAPAHALVGLSSDLPYAMVMKRFDIRKHPNDDRRIAFEDLASVRGLYARDKYTGPIDQAARALRGISVDQDTDILDQLMRTALAWLIGDGDMHLKNLGLLPIAPQGTEASRPSVWPRRMTR